MVSGCAPQSGCTESCGDIRRVELLVDGSFNGSYQRNNKKGGKKHLRCFPCCGPNHKTSNACEVPLFVQVEGDGLCPDNKSNYLAVARFLPLKDDGETVADDDLVDKLGDIALDQTIPMERLAAFERSGDDPFLPLFRARLWQYLSEANALRFEFREKAWHYGWKGGRYKQGTKHLLRIYIFVCPFDVTDSAKTNLARCVARISSPTFTVYSSRSAPKPSRVPSDETVPSSDATKRKKNLQNAQVSRPQHQIQPHPMHITPNGPSGQGFTTKIEPPDFVYPIQYQHQPTDFQVGTKRRRMGEKQPSIDSLVSFGIEAAAEMYAHTEQGGSPDNSSKGSIDELDDQVSGDLDNEFDGFGRLFDFADQIEEPAPVDIRQQREQEQQQVHQRQMHQSMPAPKCRPTSLQSDGDAALLDNLTTVLQGVGPNMFTSGNGVPMFQPGRGVPQVQHNQQGCGFAYQGRDGAYMRQPNTHSFGGMPPRGMHGGSNKSLSSIASDDIALLTSDAPSNLMLGPIHKRQGSNRSMGSNNIFNFGPEPDYSEREFHPDDFVQPNTYERDMRYINPVFKEAERNTQQQVRKDQSRREEDDELRRAELIQKRQDAKEEQEILHHQPAPTPSAPDLQQINSTVSITSVPSMQTHGSISGGAGSGAPMAAIVVQDSSWDRFKHVVSDFSQRYPFAVLVLLGLVVLIGLGIGYDAVFYPALPDDLPRECEQYVENGDGGAGRLLATVARSLKTYSKRDCLELIELGDRAMKGREEAELTFAKLVRAMVAVGAFTVLAGGAFFVRLFLSRRSQQQQMAETNATASASQQRTAGRDREIELLEQGSIQHV